MSNEEIGEIFGGTHYSAVSKVVARVERDIEVNMRLLKLIEVLNLRVET